MEQKRLSKNLDINKFFEYKSFSFIDSKIDSISELSSAFGCSCKKIILKNKKKFVIKVQNSFNSKKYLSVYYEGKSLQNMNKRFNNLFPKIFHLEKNLFIMEWKEHNNLINEQSEDELALNLAKIHSVKNNNFGYDYNSPIGGLEQPCEFEKSWISFFRSKRLKMIADEINKVEELPKEINLGLEKILTKLEKFIPESNSPCLIHGDLWSGNILFNNGKLVGLIDPSVYFAINELDLSSLYFLNTVSKDFIDKYKEHIKIEPGFNERIGIYELYYALLNVHLWSRNYINQTYEIIKRYV